MKKDYCSPEFTFIKIRLQDAVLSSDPEYINSQINEGGFGDDQGEEIIN